MAKAVTVRPASLRDAWQLASLDRACFAQDTEHWDAASYSYFLGQKKTVSLVAARGIRAGKVVGYTLANTTRAGKGYISVLCVAPQEENAGLGRILLQETCDHLAGRGMGHVDLHVRFDNLKAIGLYLRFGFRAVSVHPDFYGKEWRGGVAQDGLLMRLRFADTLPPPVAAPA